MKQSLFRKRSKIVNDSLNKMHQVNNKSVFILELHIAYTQKQKS
jgi:hypothetical protein